MTTPTALPETATFAVNLTGEPFLLDWCEETFELTVYPNYDRPRGVYNVFVSEADPHTVRKLAWKGHGHGRLGTIAAEPNGTWTACTYNSEQCGGGVRRQSKPTRSKPAALRALLDLLEGWAA